MTIKGKPSGIDKTIIKKASIKSPRTFFNANCEKTFSYNSCNSLTIYNSNIINIANALIQPINTKNLANVSNALANGERSSCINSSSPSSFY